MTGVIESMLQNLLNDGYVITFKQGSKVGNDDYPEESFHQVKVIVTKESRQITEAEGVNYTDTLQEAYMACPE